jgi:hypothetical protein
MASMMIWNSVIMSNQIPWGAAQSSQESLLEMIRPLIHIEAGNTLPNLPGKWQLNWESECLQGFIPQITKSMIIACDQISSNNQKTQSTLSQWLTVHSSALSWQISNMTNIYIHSLLLGNQTPMFQHSLASFKVASRSWTLGMLPSMLSKYSAVLAKWVFTLWSSSSIASLK